MHHFTTIFSETSAFETFCVKPCPAHLNHIRTMVPLEGKREIRMTLDKDGLRCLSDKEAPSDTTACFRNINGKRGKC